MSDKMYTQAELDRAVTAERERFKVVQTSEVFKGRETSANHMLHTTAMTAGQIGTVLSGLTPAPPATDFEKGREISARLPASLRN